MLNDIVITYIFCSPFVKFTAVLNCWTYNYNSVVSKFSTTEYQTHQTAINWGGNGKAGLLSPLPSILLCNLLVIFKKKIQLQFPFLRRVTCWLITVDEG